jgi:hypothetical protein
MSLPLLIHPAGHCAALDGIAVEIARPRPGVLALSYVASGRIDQLALPAPAAPARADALWKHTCFEAFVRTAAGYCEFNFAPSARWAAYRFDGYRAGMRDAEAPPPRIATVFDAARFEMRVTVALPPDAAGPLALCAVIEAANGDKSYWALAHPPGQPDFHHADGFVLDLPTPEQT